MNYDPAAYVLIVIQMHHGAGYAAYQPEGSSLVR